MNPEVSQILQDADKWNEEMFLLRDIALECGVIEEVKWKQACYTYNGGNLFIIGAFKDYCAINIFKGSLLKDDVNVLTSPGENSQSSKQWRFTDCQTIDANRDLIKQYIFELIEIEKAGIKAKYKSLEDYDVPEELTYLFVSDPAFENAFTSLTPGRQKGYLLFFNAAKQSKTRENRIQKYYERVMNGKGMNDCVCGKSKRMPNCDGSHNR